MGIFSKLFGNKNEALIEALENGATIIDVRTVAEYKTGHVDGSVNIPLDQIQHKLKKLKQLNKPMVLCCASGMRSANATNILKSNNIENVFNGGSWTKVDRLLSN